MGAIWEIAKRLIGSEVLRKQKEFLMFGIPTWLLAIIQVGLVSRARAFDWTSINGTCLITRLITCFEIRFLHDPGAQTVED